MPHDGSPASGSRLLFDISKCDLHRLVRDPGQRYPVMRIQDPKRGEITVEETSRYDAAEQIRDIVWYLSAPAGRDFQVIEYRLRMVFPQELRLMLAAAVLRLEARFGEFTREPFGSASPRQVCICSALP